MGFDPSELAPATLQSLLSHGAFVVVDVDEKERLRETVAGALVEADADRVAEVLGDFEAYKEWVPQLSRSEVLGKKGGHVDVEYAISFKMGLFSKTLSYAVRYKPGEKRIPWERLDGDFAENRGAWSWVPLKGKKTAVFYGYYVDLGSLGSIVKMALKASPQMEVAIQTSTAVLMARAAKARVEEA